MRDDTLESYVKDYKIFVDTCALMETPFAVFFSRVKPMLDKHSKKLFITTAVRNELQKHANQKEDIRRADDAKRAINFLNPLMEKYFDIRGFEDENFADSVFLYVFLKFIFSNNLLLITRDSDLAQDILSLKKFIKEVKSVKHKKKIDLKWLADDGDLKVFTPPKEGKV